MSEFIRINGSLNKEYKLAKWDIESFKYFNSVTICDGIFEQIRLDFLDINKIEIIQNSNIICEFTQYDTYKNIKFLPHVTTPEGEITTGYEVELMKTDITTQVERLDAKINPVIDIEAMTVDEYRDHILSQISEQCKEEIYEGQMIKLSDGSARKFSYNEQDQTNLKALFDLVVMNPQIKMLPYHANATSCEMMSREDIITIYTTLLMFLTEKTTWCNQLNMYIRSLKTKEELSAVSYNMELPDYYQYNYKVIMDQTTSQIEQMMYALLHPEMNKEEKEN
jgi:hypothetical protein